MGELVRKSVKSGSPKEAAVRKLVWCFAKNNFDLYKCELVDC